MYMLIQHGQEIRLKLLAEYSRNKLLVEHSPISQLDGSDRPWWAWLIVFTSVYVRFVVVC